MNKKALGRGLEALISETQKADKEFIDYINVDKIKPNKYQPRGGFDKQKLDELAASIKEKGVVQPILVRPSGEAYELIAGERRLKAVRTLGFNQIPAVIKDVDDISAIELSLIENIQREELNPLDEARAYQKLIDEFNYTQEVIGQAVGKDRATVANNLRLLSLPKKVQEMLSKNLISAGHAKVILSLEDTIEQIGLSKRVIEKGLSVRSLENIIRRKGRLKKRPVAADSNIHLVADKIQERLGTKVRIRHGKKRGTIQIEYYSTEDLERILKILGCGE